MQNKHRKRTPEDIIIGVKPVEEALLAGKSIDKVLMQRGLQGDAVRKLRTALREHGIWIQDVPAARLDRITRKNHQGVIAFGAPVAFHDLEQLLPGLYESGDTPLIVALNGVTDVRNFGAIARSAECMGAHAVVVPERNTARIGPDAVKTSAGALLRIPVCKVRNLSDSVRYMQEFGLHIAGISEHSNATLQEVPFAQPTCLVMGSEFDGIHPDILKLCDTRAKIPMQGEINSLNVSVAAGVALYECQRQRLSK